MISTILKSCYCWISHSIYNSEKEISRFPSHCCCCSRNSWIALYIIKSTVWILYVGWNHIGSVSCCVCFAILSRNDKWGNKYRVFLVWLCKMQFHQFQQLFKKFIYELNHKKMWQIEREGEKVSKKMWIMFEHQKWWKIKKPLRIWSCILDKYYVNVSPMI